MCGIVGLTKFEASGERASATVTAMAEKIHHRGPDGGGVVFHPDAPWTVTPAALRSQGKHTPFEGHELPVSVRATLVAGQIPHAADRETLSA